MTSEQLTLEPGSEDSRVDDVEEFARRVALQTRELRAFSVHRLESKMRTSVHRKRDAVSGTNVLEVFVVCSSRKNKDETHA